MIFEELGEFRQDVKGLSRKYKSLQEDLRVVRKVLMVMPEERPPFSVVVKPGAAARVIKISKIACKSLKGQGVNSGINVLYAFFEKDRRIVMVSVFPERITSAVEQRILSRKI